MQDKLKSAKTMRDILDIVDREYDLTDNLGIATKIIVIQGLDKVLKLIKAKRKNGG
jgi:hypothetical protein